jgi:hypothetical protein
MPSVNRLALGEKTAEGAPEAAAGTTAVWAHPASNATARQAALSRDRVIGVLGLHREMAGILGVLAGVHRPAVESLHAFKGSAGRPSLVGRPGPGA